jgi:hypothetical protein
MTLNEQIRTVWKEGKIERIAAVVDGLRFALGMNFNEVHERFCSATGEDIPLPSFDAVMYARDEGYTGTLWDLTHPDISTASRGTVGVRS